MFMVLNASESRSLRRGEGIFVADLLKEQQDTPSRSDDGLYSSFHTLKRVPSASQSGSPSGASSSAMSMMSSMSRALSALSTKTSAIFQRKRIPEFTARENDVVIIRNELPRIVITPADNAIYRSSVPDSSADPSTLVSFLAQKLLLEEPLGGAASLGSVEMIEPGDSRWGDGRSSTASSSPSSGPSTPSQGSQDLPNSIEEDEMDANYCTYSPNKVSSRLNQQVQRGRNDKTICTGVDAGKFEGESPDTLENTEIDLMFHREGNNDIVNGYRKQRWAQIDGSEGSTSSADTASEDLSSSVELVPTITTIIHMTKQPSSSNIL